MPVDQAPPIQVSQAPNWRLPQILKVRIAAKPYEPRPTQNFPNPLQPVPDAVEIVVTLAAPIPARALGPELHVGEARLTESETVDGNRTEVRFWALNPTSLRAGAAITLAWNGEVAAEEPSRARFTYEPPRQ
jgi:hypothetical protein